MFDRAPRALPHLVRRDREVFFLASRRPCLTLDDEDVALFDSLDGSRTLSEFTAAHPSAVERVLEWRRRRLVLAVPRVPPSKAASHVVVIEPHMDDAALSIGGILAHKRGRERITIVSVVRESNFTSYAMQGRAEYADVATVTALRSAEAALAAQMLGAETRAVGEVDALLRFTRSRGREDMPLSRLDAAVRAWMRFGPTDAEVAHLADALTSTLRDLEPDELWVPLGAGGHVDHVRTREACLAIVARGDAIAPRVLFFEDLPHVSRYPDQPEQIGRAMRACGAELSRMTEDITDVFEDKLEVVSAYASQFKMHSIEPLLVQHAEAAAGKAGGRAEVFYELRGVPRALPPRRATATHAARIEQVREQLLPWCRGAEDLRRLVLVAATPLGDCARLVQALSDRFPHAKLEIVVDRAHEDELAAAGGRIEVVVEAATALARVAAEREASGAHVLWVGDAKERTARRLTVRDAADVVLALA